jgi:hypothetical protein
MKKEKLKEDILQEFYKGLDENIGFDSKYGTKLIFHNSWIFIVMFDYRLFAGDNTQKIYLYNEIGEGEFHVPQEKLLVINNNPITKQYQYRAEENTQSTLPTKEEVKHKIKMNLPNLVDSFLKIIEKNNEFLNRNL